MPEIRFEEFSEEWEKEKSADIFHSVSDKGHSDLPVLSATQDRGMVFRDDVGIDIQYNKKSTKNYKRVLPNQFVIHLRSFQGGFAFSNIEGITSPAYTVLDFQNKENYYSLFWKYVFASNSFIKKLETVTYGIRDGRSISFKDFSTLYFQVPSYQEQRKIGDFIEHLDDTIALHQQELDTLKQTKQGFLQKMFPKEGTLEPEVRFHGFSSAWQSQRLGEVVGITKGSQKNRNSLSELLTTDSPYPVYNGGIGISGYTNEFNRESSITISEGGASAGHVNYVYGKFWSGGHNYTLDVVDNDVSFIKSYLDFKQKRLYTLKVGSGLPNIQRSALEGFKIKIPLLEEQQKIGTFFKQLDDTIALHEQELETLKQTKEAFLQKMFV